MRLEPAFLLLMVVGWLRAFGATGGDDLQTTDFSRRWLRDSINPRTGRLILEITNETIVTNMPMTGTGFLHITDDLPDPEARAVDLSTDDVEGDLDILHFDGGLNANVNTFWRGDGTWSVVPANGVTPAGTGFTHNTSGTQDPDARAVDLSTPDVVGNLDVSHLDGGVGASAMTYWRGDKKWAPITGASGGTVTSVDVVVPGFMTVSGGPITTAGIITIGLSGSKLPITSVGAPSGNGFGHVTSGIWDPAAKAVDLSTVDVTGNLPVAHLNSGITATDGTFWRGDGVWTNVLRGNFQTLEGGMIFSSSGFNPGTGPITYMMHNGVIGSIGVNKLSGSYYTPLALSAGGLNAAILQTNGTVTINYGFDSMGTSSVNGSPLIVTSTNKLQTGGSLVLSHTGNEGVIESTNYTGGYKPLSLKTGGAERMRILTNGQVNVLNGLDTVSGYTVGGAAASGNYLRGNGTAFVASSLLASDLSGTIPVGSVGAPTGTGFGHVTGGVWDAAARAVDLSGADATGILAPARAAGAYGGITGVGALTSGSIGGSFGDIIIPNQAITGNYGTFNGGMQAGVLLSDLRASLNSSVSSSVVKIGTSVGAPGTVTDALFLDAYCGTAYDQGAALSFGYKSSALGDFTSRIVHYGYIGATRATRLQLQTHSDTAGLWYPGITISEFGLVGIGLTNPATALEVSGTARANLVDGTTGFTVAGAAGAGKYLRGNGTAFVSSSLLASDLTGTIPIGSVASPTGTGFGHVTGGIWDGVARVVDLSTADVTGNLPVARLNGGVNADTSTFWRGDGTWTNTLGATDLLVTFTGTNSSNLKLDAGNNGDVGILFSRSGINAWHNFMINPSTSLSWYNNGGFKMTLNISGVLDTAAGYTVGGAAATGKYLRGNGTAFVASSLLASDLSGTIPVGSVGAPTGNGFGHVTGGVWDAAARAVDLSGADATGILAPARVAGAYGGITGVGALTSGSIGGSFGDIIVPNQQITGHNATLDGMQAGFLRSKGWTNGAVPTVSVGANIIPRGTVFDALFLDAYGSTAFDQGAALAFGYKDNALGEFTSRIVHYGNIDSTRATRLQLQTHSDTAGLWYPGITISQFGLVGIGLTNPATALEVSGTARANLVDGTTGFTVAGAAGTGKYLRGNGTAFVSSSLLASDLSGTIPIGSVAAPTGNGFGHVTGGVWDAAATAVNLGTADVTGNLPVSKLNGGTGANSATYWRGDNTWAPIPGSIYPIGTGFWHLTGGAPDSNARAVDLSGADATGILAAARHPALAGDVTSVAGSLTTTLANTAVTPGTYGSATTVPQVAVDAKGRVTSASSVAITFPAGYTPPTGTGFSHITGGVQDPASRAVDLSGTDVTGILNPARVSGPYTGISQVGSLASGTVASDYGSGALTLREANFASGTPSSSTVPRLVFFHGGFSATQLEMDPVDAYLAVRDQNGTGYKGFRGSFLDATLGFWLNGAGPAGKYLRGNGTAFVSSSLLASDLTGTIPIANVAAPTGTGFGHVTGGVWDGASKAVDLSGVDATGILAAARHPALAGDVTSVAGSLTTTLANTAVTPGTYGSATTVPVVTVDSKGRVTAASTATLTAPANTGVFPIKVVTANYTFTAADYTVVANVSPGITLTLPSATANPGKIFIAKGGYLAPGFTIAPGSGDFIDNGGALSVTGGTQAALMVQSDGGHQWYLLQGAYSGLVTRSTNNVAAPRTRSAARGRTVTR